LVAFCSSAPFVVVSLPDLALSSVGSLADGTISSDFFAERDPPPPNRLKNLPVIGPKMQEKTSTLKNVDLQNKSSHVILRNLYAASFLVWPACVLM
jgi:hypothetical protein